MGKSSRKKGDRGEREAIGLLQPVVDEVCVEKGHVRLELRRNYAQRFAAKEYDVIGCPWIALEVKRVENQSGLAGWWRQVLASCREGQVPVLMYRQNNRRWKVRMLVLVAVAGSVDGARAGRFVRMPVDVDIDAFLVWFKQKLLMELK